MSIPVFLKMGDDNPIGFGVIEDDQLVITVKTLPIVTTLASLVDAEHIKELYLGFGYPIDSGSARVAMFERRTVDREAVQARAVDMHDRNFTNAEIADVLGLAESTVRTIIEDK